MNERERWARAFAKVERRCLGIRKVRNAYEVASDSGNVYRVTGINNVCTGCTCLAGSKGQPCFHQAAVYCAMGVTHVDNESDAAVYALIGAFDHLRPVEVAPLAPDAMTETDRGLLLLHHAAWDAAHGKPDANRLHAARNYALGTLYLIGMDEGAAEAEVAYIEWFAQAAR